MNTCTCTHAHIHAGIRHFRTGYYFCVSQAYQHHFQYCAPFISLSYLGLKNQKKTNFTLSVKFSQCRSHYLQPRHIVEGKIFDFNTHLQEKDQMRWRWTDLEIEKSSRNNVEKHLNILRGVMTQTILHCHLSAGPTQEITGADQALYKPLSTPGSTPVPGCFPRQRSVHYQLALTRGSFLQLSCLVISSRSNGGKVHLSIISS